MSKFFDLPGSHKPAQHEGERNNFRGRNESLSYFDYGSTTATRHATVSLSGDEDNQDDEKLGTYDGVFVPTTLNVLSILMFLRFGFIIGQMGVIGTLVLLLLSYAINLLTTLSISAIAANGTVRGGGAYYMISRSLGPEFGGSIGLVFFMGQILNSGMNAVGIIEPLLYNFGSKIDSETPSLFPLLSRGYWHEFAYASVVLLLCLTIAIVGSAMVSRAGKVLFWFLLLATISIPVSSLLRAPFFDNEITYTGPSLQTLKENLFPHLTKGAAGSVLKGKENFNDLFGIFFPATAGIFAGAGMSSELRQPSKSIPKGTLWGLLLTFTCYTIVIGTVGLCVPRDSLYRDVQIIQTISSSQILILIGELSTSLFSVIVGIVGAAYVLEAIAKDSILPGLSIFQKNSNYCILFSWLLTQICLFSDVNRIATFITMTFLVTFVVMNLACFLLELSAAPNFRPSFKYFDRFTALMGAILSIIAMFVVDGISASVVIMAISVIFIVIHFYSPPRSWGDVSQGLIYHQVRKYLLRLRQDNVKYWRPQILLLVDNPRTSWNLIRFCNHLKKGGLYVLGHVTVGKNFQSEYSEFRKQTKAWMTIRDMAHIKAFVQIGTGTSLAWGVRNVFLGSGLGGMKPNITVIGFFDLANHYKTKNKKADGSESNSQSLRCMRGSRTDQGDISIEMTPELGSLPTDECKNERKITIQQWVQIIEDLSLMQSNIAVAHDFENLNLPSQSSKSKGKGKRFIDLYPIQMSATMTLNDETAGGITTTNFDTYTLILQLGAILITVPDWKRTHTLRVAVFVEDASEKYEETKKVRNLLSILRIDAELLVLSLDSFRIYNTIVKGDPVGIKEVDIKLQGDSWWSELKEARTTHRSDRRFLSVEPNTISVPRLTRRNSVRYNVSKLQRLGVSMTMTSSVPNDNYQFPISSDEEDEEDEEDNNSTTMGSSSTLLSANKTKQQGLPPKSNISALKKATTKSSDAQSVLSLMPVFSSDAIPKTKVIEDATGGQPSLIPIVENDHVNGKQNNTDKNPILPTLSPRQSSETLMNELQSLSFNNIPSRAQHLILNDVMFQVSRSSDLIFSTLPLPALNTHANESASLEYAQNMELWLAGLPPTMLINSKSMTVTTAL
ncbi:LAMI_0F08240g1_1 [Lachancea mirantina]|uniref:LAMI_0F08240g1_1 n=1 Tax=Lachancea mirantina TaxID=1230905 RepID=A0A1G4K0A8_9SACH|nr:LAMI_0F08240g1_1 [Lachancea mirantina]